MTEQNWPADKVERRKVADLIPYARNSRTHSDEQTGRDCRMMELDPKYCDVIIIRWQNFTGQSATLESTGQTYTELQAERGAA